MYTFLRITNSIRNISLRCLFLNEYHNVDENRDYENRLWKLTPIYANINPKNKHLKMYSNVDHFVVVFLDKTKHFNIKLQSYNVSYYIIIFSLLFLFFSL